VPLVRKIRDWRTLVANYSIDPGNAMNALITSFWVQMIFAMLEELLEKNAVNYILLRMNAWNAETGIK